MQGKSRDTGTKKTKPFDKNSWEKYRNIDECWKQKNRKHSLFVNRV